MACTKRILWYQTNLLSILVLVDFGYSISSSTSGSFTNSLCTFPPKPLGGNFKVLKLYPRKSVKYFCDPGFHLWGQEIVECNPDQGWPNNDKSTSSSSVCLVDSALNKLAYSSSSGKSAIIPLKRKKYSRHAGNKKKFLAFFSPQK